MKPIVIEAGPKIWNPAAKQMVGLRIEIPAGTPQAMVGNLLYKQLIDDLVLSKTDFNALKTKLKSDQAANELKSMLDEFLQPGKLSEPMRVLDAHRALITKYYMTNTDFWENSGHPFGTGLTDKEKKALMAFVATL